MTTKPIRPILIAALVAASLLVPGLAGPAAADQLVLFRNGKVMRVKSATEDGKWLKCDFDGTNFISVPRADVRGIEQAAAGSREGELRVNQVAEGTGTPYVPPRAQPGFAAEAEGAPAPAQQEVEMAADEVPQPTAVGQPGGRRTPGGRLQMSNPTLQPAGFQPLNQVRTPFQGRSGRGLSNRNSGLPIAGSQRQGEQ